MPITRAQEQKQVEGTMAEPKDLLMKRTKKMGGGKAMMPPRKQRAYGGSGRKKMKTGGKAVRGPCS
jgi:hypothetical protein|tara:strand:- start:1118 stop:1315 length:198 start_codon:yes stop_codon:yes gene_type:complete